MLFAAGALGLAVLGALLTGSPGPGVAALPVPDHVHVVHRGLPPAALPRPLVPLVLPVQRRRVHVLDPRTAINLVNAHESRRRRGSKRPPPYHRRGPPRPGPPRPSRWKGPPKRKGHGGPRDKPWTQATRGSSPAATRVRYQSGKPPRSKSKSKKSKGKARPLLPTYADGYAEDEEVLHGPPRDPEDADTEEDRPRKHRPSKASSSVKQQQLHQQGGYTKAPKGWGPDGGYRVPAPQYPPYGTDEEEPGTGHLDLEERFINQHNQFYQHGYPADSGESAPASTQSKRHKPGRGQGHGQGHGQGLYEDEEIEVAEAADFDGGVAATSHSTRQQSYRRPSKTRYSLQDGALHEADDDSREDEYRRPSYSSGSSSSKGRGKKKHSDRDHRDRDRGRHQSMYHAKFREQQDDRTLSAANFNYELTGAASETAQSAVSNNGDGGGHQDGRQGGHQGGNNHRPAYDAGEGGGITDVRTVDTNFFRTRKPQYWG